MIKVTNAEMEESMTGPVGPLMICTTCGERDYTPMESDAYNYECPSCGNHTNCSAEELLVRGELEIT